MLLFIKLSFSSVLLIRQIHKTNKSTSQTNSLFLPSTQYGYLTFMFNAYNLLDRDIGFVIGTMGNKIQAIQRETGATVKLVKVPPNTGMMSYFHITSFSQDSVNAAWAAIHNAATLAMQLNTGTIERKNQEPRSISSGWSRFSAVTLSAQGRTFAASTARWAPASSRLWITRVARLSGLSPRPRCFSSRCVVTIAKTSRGSLLWTTTSAGRLARRAPSRSRRLSRST